MAHTIIFILRSGNSHYDNLLSLAWEPPRKINVFTHTHTYMIYIHVKDKFVVCTSSARKKWQINRICCVFFQDGNCMHFTHIAALYSELVAVSSGGHLCQWRWNDFEPYANLEVCCGLRPTSNKLTTALKSCESQNLKTYLFKIAFQLR